MSSNTLPVELTSFIGREDEVADLTRRLAGTRLLTLTGAGGAGKTRLAVEAARGFRTGDVWFVDLSPILDAALVPNAIATAAGMAELQGESPIESLTGALRSARGLLVLDNCEHLVAACAAAVEHLLKSCPSLTLLATSREPLNVPGEVVRRVPGLSPSEAAALFVERATAAEPEFAPGPESDGSIENLCEQLDGLPLAIELAAACVRVLTIPEIAARLSERLDLLSSRSTPVTGRHQTLRALVDWSYERLSVSEQKLYRRLSVFAGGCTLGAIEAICRDESGTAAEVLPLLRGLVEKSLVIAEQQEGETRYRMLETLRQHSREKLREAGEERALRRRHLDWFRDLAEQGEMARWGAGQDRWQRRLEGEIENCRVALAWSRIEPEQQETGLNLAAALVWPWRISGHASEAFEWLTTLLSGAPPKLARANGLRAAGWLAHRRVGPDARPLLDEALTLARMLRERSLVVATLRDLAFLRLARGDPAAAEAAAKEGLTLAQMPAVIPWRYTLLRPLGLAVAAMGRRAEGVVHLREAVRLSREQQDLYITGLALRDLGRLLLDLGDLAVARSCLEDSLALELPRRAPEAPIALAILAGLAVADGEMARAVRLAGAASGLREAWPDGSRPALLPRLDQQLKTASEALSPALRQAAWAEGAAMSLDAAIDYALRRGSRDSNVPERPGGLTPRELEVVRLLAGRLTNRQIADALVISERTAGRHVENILGKLHLNNRAQVAEWTAERGLVQPSDR